MPTGRLRVHLGAGILGAAVLAAGPGAAGAAGDGGRPQVIVGDVLVHDAPPCAVGESVRATLPQVEATIAALRTDGVIPDGRGTPDHPLLEIPLRAAAHYDWPGFSYILGHYDHDFGNGLLDYACGSRTHNAGDGAHSGIDYNLHPFDWAMMDGADVEVVAAARGVIVLRFDGFDDRSCPGTAGPDWNGVTIRHDDGSLGYYVHFKNGSTTPKGIGESVEVGEYLGVVGSSGPSVSPHLHFAILDHTPDRNDIDPYAGPCNDFNDESWWVEQPPYVQPGIDLFSTHHALVQLAPCPDPDEPNFSDVFMPGETVYLYTFGHDGTSGDEYAYEIEGPDGSILDSWTYVFPLSFALGYSIPLQWALEPGAAIGTYRARVEHFGVVHEHAFAVESSVPVESDPGESVPGIDGTRFLSIRPNPLTASTTLEVVVPARGEVELAILDVGGRIVRTLEGPSRVGRRLERTWDGRDENGRLVPSGAYFVRLRAAGLVDTRRISVVR